MKTNEYLIRAIGAIETPFRESAGTPIQPIRENSAEGVIALNPEYGNGLKDLAGFSHIIALYVFDRVREGFELAITPFLDTTPRGLFATRAPRRPNPIGLSVLEIIGIEGTRIRVRGVDMLDGTPLIDIKPFVPDFDSPANARTGWLEAKSGSADTTRDDGRFR